MTKLFKVILHRKAVKELDNLSPKDRSGIVEALKEMETDPFIGDVKPVKGLRGAFRRRAGDYRIIYTVNSTR
ncbi:MAG: type II toxin-antitoxin system RelE/ParE family toxin [Candidatus Bathyarchaeia archaeon]